jgi:hypothetical protein
MTRRIVARFAQHQRVGATRRELHLDGMEGGQRTLFWEMAGEFPEPPVLDACVLGAAPLALEQRRDLHIEGPVSRTCLANLNVWVRLRADWQPRLFPIVPEITAATVVDQPPQARPARAVLAFSGGVDSSYSLLRHARDLPQGAALPLEAAVLGHGFDVPLADQAAMDAMLARYAPVVEGRFGVPLRVVRTNLREASLGHWEMAAMAAIGSAIAQFAHLVDWGLLAGGVTTELQQPPKVQTPLTDALFSTDTFTMRHDGGGITRTAKVARIAAEPALAAILKVCWDPKAPDRAQNCGVCGKCRRTMLNFLAAGHARPACFAVMPEPMDLAEARIDGVSDRRYMAMLVAEAHANGQQAPWLDRLEATVAAWRPPRQTAASFRRLAARWRSRVLRDPVGAALLAARRLAERLPRGDRRPL